MSIICRLLKQIAFAFSGRGACLLVASSQLKKDSLVTTCRTDIFIMVALFIRQNTVIFPQNVGRFSDRIVV